jgi:demethoxyubiquinone hydroxylase (CLK1/Coq7/Cat5 family)
MAVSMKESVDKLCSFLRGEISAVETYRQALAAIRDPEIRTTLEECHLSHEQRVARLREVILRLGGTPPDGSGPWGAFAKLVQGGADSLGESAALAALEEGEDHGLRDYRGDLSVLDATSRALVGDLLLEQQRTHAAMSTLKRARKARAEVAHGTTARR